MLEALHCVQVCFGAGTSSARHTCDPQNILSYALLGSPWSESRDSVAIKGAIVVSLVVPACQAAFELQLHHQLQAKHFTNDKVQLNAAHLSQQNIIATPSDSENTPQVLAKRMFGYWTISWCASGPPLKLLLVNP